MTAPSIHLYRYGESRDLPGLSIGITRQPPRGVRKEERAARGYFDVWLPLLGPSRELLTSYRNSEISFADFTKRYRTEMNRPEPRQVITLLAALALDRRINLGCFCEDSERCHRTLLRDLILEAAAEIPSNQPKSSSSPCYLSEFFEEE